jgi:nicotinamidase-related amidase
LALSAQSLSYLPVQKSRGNRIVIPIQTLETEMTNKALILIDIQNDYFPGGSWEVHEMPKVANNAAKLLAEARKLNQLIIHVRHEIPSDQAPFFRPGSEGAQIHKSVLPANAEPVILKHKANSFADTNLQQLLQAAEISEMTICGAMTQMCIDATTRAASDLRYNVTVVEDACGAKEQVFKETVVPADHVHAAIMAPLAMSYATVVGTEQFLNS